MERHRPAAHRSAALLDRHGPGRRPPARGTRCAACGATAPSTSAPATPSRRCATSSTTPHVVVTAGPLGADGWGSGKDIAVEGVAERVEDEALLQALTEEWRTKYDGDWIFEARDGRFFEVSNQGDGSGDGAVVFRVPPGKVLVFGDEHGQTTYRF